MEPITVQASSPSSAIYATVASGVAAVTLVVTGAPQVIAVAVATPEARISVAVATTRPLVQITTLTQRGSPGAPGDPGIPGPAALFTQEDFVAVDGQTSYMLAHTITQSPVWVMINGLLQQISEYSDGGNQVVFHSGSGIVAGDIISVRYNF